MIHNKDRWLATVACLIVIALLALYLDSHPGRRIGSETPHPTETTEATTKHFESQALGFAFDYPAKFGEVEVNTYSGDVAGKGYLGSFRPCAGDGCQSMPLQFGGTTADFSSAREVAQVEKGTPWFKEHGKYYYGSASDPRRREIPYRAEEVRGANVTGLILYGKDTDDVSPGELSRGARQALFPTHSKDFGTLSFVWMSNETSDSAVLDVLRTVTVTDPQ